MSSKNEIILITVLVIFILLIIFSGVYYLPRSCTDINDFDIGDKVVVNDKLDGTVVDVYRNCVFVNNFKVSLNQGSTSWYSSDVLKNEENTEQ